MTLDVFMCDFHKLQGLLPGTGMLALPLDQFALLMGVVTFQNNGFFARIDSLFDKTTWDVFMGEVHKLQGFLLGTGTCSRCAWDLSHCENDGILDANLFLTR